MLLLASLVLISPAPLTFTVQPPESYAGDYYFGDGLGVNCSLKLSSDRTFEFMWHGCLGVYGQNKGSFGIEGDELVLKPDRPNDPRQFGDTQTRFYPITWSDRTYLISEDKMLSFCQHIEKGWNG